MDSQHDTLLRILREVGPGTIRDLLQKSTAFGQVTRMRVRVGGEDPYGGMIHPDDSRRLLRSLKAEYTCLTYDPGTQELQIKDDRGVASSIALHALDKIFNQEFYTHLDLNCGYRTLTVAPQYQTRAVPVPELPAVTAADLMSAYRQLDKMLEATPYNTPAYVDRAGRAFYLGNATFPYSDDVAPVSTPVPRRHTREPIRGWRAWRLFWSREEGWYLVSVSFTTPWEGPIHHADEAPSEVNSRGIHTHLLTHRDMEEHCVQGEVSLWGTVTVHEKGYRAEHARINRLVVSPGLSVLSTLHLTGYTSTDVRQLTPAHRATYARDPETPDYAAIVRDLEAKYHCEVTLLDIAPEAVGKEIMAEHKKRENAAMQDFSARLQKFTRDLRAEPGLDLDDMLRLSSERSWRAEYFKAVYLDTPGFLSGIDWATDPDSPVLGRLNAAKSRDGFPPHIPLSMEIDS